MAPGLPARSICLTCRLPAHRPVTLFVPSPARGSGPQSNEYGPTAPDGFTFAVPSQLLKQVASTNTRLGVIGGGARMMNVMVVSQPLASATSTV